MNRLLLICSVLTTACVSAEETNSPFLNAPAWVGKPQSQHEPGSRTFQGIPSLAVTTGGRMWATWYAGPTPREDHNNYVVVAASSDSGRSWQEVLIVDPDEGGPVRAFDPEIWQAPNGQLWLFWAQAVGHDGTIAGVWSVTLSVSTDGSIAASAPRRLTDGVMMCKPLVLSTGEWILPASTWRGTDNSARVVVSQDQGQSWVVRGACQVPPAVRNFDEHMLIERTDRSLWLLARTKYGIGQSVSTDRGITWPELTPSDIVHPAARFFVRRLQSGNLLLVKHGTLRKRSGRSLLTAYLSTDDGVTWQGGLLLDERAGVSYPDGQQDETGRIHVVYDYHRVEERQILFASFREEDILAQQAVSDDVQLRQLISDPGKTTGP